MTNSNDCPPKANNEVRAEFLDTAEVEQRSKEALINERARRIAGWKNDTLPNALADNAARLHTHNKDEKRKAGAIIDAHRRTPEGRAAYNEKQNATYAEKKGSPPREYVARLSAEDRAERDRVKNAAAQAKSRGKKTTAEQSTARAERRRRTKEREAEAAELEAIAREAGQKIF